MFSESDLISNVKKICVINMKCGRPFNIMITVVKCTYKLQFMTNVKTNIS